MIYEEIAARIKRLSIFLEISIERNQLYKERVENLNVINDFKPRYRKDIYFNELAQKRIKKAIKREILKLYELIND